MVRLKVQEDNIKMKMNAPDGATFRTNEYTPIMRGSSDYNELDNKPSIEGVTLEGNKTLEELGAFSGDYDDLDNKPSINGVTLNGNKSLDDLGIESEIFLAEYGVTSFQDISDALEDGKSVVCKYEVEMNGQTVMTAYFSNIVDYIAYQQIVFAAVLNDQTLTLTVDSADTWADVWGTNVTDVKVNGSSILSQGVANLSNVAVSGSYNDLGDKPEQTEEVTVSTSGDVTYSLEANKIYHFTGQISSLTLTLVATSLVPHYHFDFVSGTTPATISFGSSINWLGGEGLTPQSSMHYEVDILNGRGIFAEFPAR